MFLFVFPKIVNITLENTQDAERLRVRDKQTFIRKNVILVRRSTVDLRSCSRDVSDAGNVF